MDMKKWILSLFLLLAPLLGFAQELVEKIEVIGLDRLLKEQVVYYLSVREGDYYNEEILKKDFRTLWSTGFFSNLKIEQQDGTKGKIVKIIVEENPVVKAVTYKTGKKVKEDDIVNKLKEKDEYILPYSYYSPYKIQKVKRTIEDLLTEKGLGAAKVDVEAAKKGKNEVDVVFKVDEGPKVRVGEVDFVGRPKLPQSILREAMKENQQHSVVSWVTAKDVYKLGKLTDDMASVKKKLQENGYMEATVGEPKIEEVTKKTFWPFSKKRMMMKITVPVNAGYLYKVGEVKVEGNKAFTTPGILSYIKFKKGEIYSTKVREKSVEDLGELMRNYGFWYGQIIPVENLDPKNKVVNVTYNIMEGEITYIHRLDIKGNIYTKDKVIRRELLVREGDRFSLALFKDSVLRVKQLGLVDIEKDPDIKPMASDPTQFDITLYLKELQRNNIQFTAGYSGYEGTFIAVSYSTVNFLGAGETLDITAQYGARIQNYSFGFSEPYFLDNPISLGFNVYDRSVIYPYLYDRKDRGIDLTSGARLFGWARGSLTYSLDFVDIKLPSTQENPDSVAAGTALTSYIDPIYYQMYGLGKYYMSSISPTLYRSTVDSPLTPTSGTMILASLKYAGTFLGGEIHLYKPRFEFTHFQPIAKGHTIGFHIEYSYIKPLRNSQIPFWEKFYLGGERNIRGYEIYSIGPRSSEGTMIGGEKQFVMNAEYTLQVGGPLYLIAFYDRGNAYGREERVSWANMFSSAGIEARIFVPALRVPFRLIFAYNNKRIYSTDSNFAFRFAIGTTF
jgi:outer membrane protein insertion porin family